MGCPIGELFFTYDYLNVLKLRAIQIEVFSSSVATHMPWATGFGNVLPTSADSTLDSVIQPCLRRVHYLCTWFPWDLWSCLVTSRVSVSAHPVPGLASPVFSGRLLLKDFVSYFPLYLKVLCTWILETKLFLPVGHSILAWPFTKSNYSRQHKGSLHQAWSWKDGLWGVSVLGFYFNENREVINDVFCKLSRNVMCHIFWYINLSIYI